MNERDLWPRVHALLDARRDPLADAEVQAWLADDVEAMASVVALRAVLSTLPRRRSVVRVAAAAALVVMAIGGAWSAWRWQRTAASRAAPVAAQPADQPSPLPFPDLLRGDFVRAFTATVEVLGDDASVTVTRTEHNVTCERRTQWVAASPDSRVTLEVSSLDTNLR